MTTDELNIEKPHRVSAALTRYRAADDEMRTRARQSTGLTDNELRIIQLLVEAATADRHVTPTDIAKHLGITSASTTALLDRLERSGAVHRAPHPSDRRSLRITVTDRATENLRSTLTAFDVQTRRVAESLSESDARAVADYLERLADAADQIAAGTA
jgi:DNA-binding MarR family transcriptional regulator